MQTCHAAPKVYDIAYCSCTMPLPGGHTAEATNTPQGLKPTRIHELIIYGLILVTEDLHTPESRTGLAIVGLSSVNPQQAIHSDHHEVEYCRSRRSVRETGPFGYLI